MNRPDGRFFMHAGVRQIDALLLRR